MTRGGVLGDLVLGTLREAARNALAISPLGRGIEPDHATPRVLLQDAPHARVERFLPGGTTTSEERDPVLLITPPGVTSGCWDLRPGQSLGAHLAGSGRPTYTIDYGRITFADRGMGIEEWVCDLLPPAVRAVSAAHDGRPVHLVGWSHGGTLAILLAAHDHGLPIASIVALGTPTDYRRNPYYAPLFGLNALAGLDLVTAPIRLAGTTTPLLTQLGYRWMSPLRELTKPWTLANNLLDNEVLARIEAVDRFVGAMPGYPARFINQALSRIVVGRELVAGALHLRDGLVIDVQSLRAPLLLVGSKDDVLASADSVEAGVVAYPLADARFHPAHGLSHLGLIASPRAVEMTWPEVDRHLARWDRAGTIGFTPRSRSR